MASLDAHNTTVHNNSSRQSGSAENSHSPSIQYETVTRHQQYESIVDTGYEQLTAQYEALHNNTLEHIDEVVSQVNQLEGKSTASRWVNNVDIDGYLQVPNNKDNVAFDAEEYLQVLNGNDVALSEQPGDGNQRDQKAAGVDSYGYLQPVVRYDAEVHALPSVRLDCNDVTAADFNTSNRSHPLYTTQDVTPPNPLYTAQGDATPNPLYTTQGNTPPNPLYTAQDDTPNRLYTAQNHANRPRLPTPRVSYQPSSNTTFSSLKLPLRPRLCLVLAASVMITAAVSWLIIYLGLRHDTIFQFDETFSGHLSTATTRLPQLTLQPFVTRSPALTIGQIRSAKHKTDFKPRATARWPVSILSVSSKSQLLVGRHLSFQLHVCNASCSHVTSITLPDYDGVYDAVWTSNDRIVYSSPREQVVTMLQLGVVIQETHVLSPSHLSVSTDGVIYLISAETIVYQSTDDGLTWSPMFKITDGWKCWQVIKVSTDSNADVLWTLIWSVEGSHLRVYTVYKRRKIGGNVAWRDLALPSRIIFSIGDSKLAYDGHSNIFVTDFSYRAVHVWSVSGQYGRQLMSRQQDFVYCLAVDTQHHVMYVGQVFGDVGVFELTYEPL